MAMTPKLTPILEAGKYKLIQYNPQLNEYDIMQGNLGPIARIRVDFQCVIATTENGTSYVPYDIDIDIIETCTPLSTDFFRKIIMATLTIS